jgi:hypothetical protein
LKKVINIEKIINRINRINPFFLSLIIFIYLAGTSYLTKNTWLIACDMAEYMNNPFRVLYGELPYRDFWLLFMPGEVYFPALIYKLFGFNINIVSLFSILVSSLTGSFAFFLARQFLKNNFESALLSLVFFFTSVIFTYEGPVYNHLYLTFSVLSALYLIKYFNFQKNKFLFISGIFLGCGFFFRFYEMGAIAAAFTLTIIVYFIINKFDFKSSAKSFSLFISGIFIILIIIIFAFNSIISEMFRDVILESIKNGTSMNLPYFYHLKEAYNSLALDLNDVFILRKFGGIFELLFHLGLSTTYFIYYTLPFIITILFILYIYTKPLKNEFIIPLLFFLWGIFSFPKGLGRSDIAHLAPSFIPFIFLIYYLAKQSGSYNYPDIKVKIIKYVSITIVILTLFPLTHPYTKLINLKRKSMVAVNTKRGTIPFKKQQDATDFKAVMSFIVSNTSQNDYIFVTCWDTPPLYVLSGRRNPTYYDSLNDLLIRESEDKQLKICQDILEKNTKIIIHNPDFVYDNKPEQSFRRACSILQNFITTNYKLAARYNDYYIYVK